MADVTLQANLAPGFQVPGGLCWFIVDSASARYPLNGNGASTGTDTLSMLAGAQKVIVARYWSALAPPISNGTIGIFRDDDTVTPITTIAVGQTPVDTTLGIGVDGAGIHARILVPPGGTAPFGYVGFYRVK